MRRSVEGVVEAVKSLRADPDPFETKVLIGPEVRVAALRDQLEGYARTLGPEDTFVMYSHTHGVPQGLLLDFGPPRPEPFRWPELAAAILAIPARDVIVMAMSCHSGHLTQTIEALGAGGRGRRKEGRNFLVVSSVAAEQLSGSSREPGIANSFTYAAATAAFGGPPTGSPAEPSTPSSISASSWRMSAQRPVSGVQGGPTIRKLMGCTQVHPALVRPVSARAPSSIPSG